MTPRPDDVLDLAEHRAERRPVETYAVVLGFDEFSERRIRQAWSALDERGVASAATTYSAGYRPHVTLAIVETGEPDRLATALRRTLSEVTGMSLTLSAVGFFLTERSPVYLAVTPTRRLLELHDEVHRVIGPTGSWAYYRPGSWMPHCTLAMDVVCQTTVAEALEDTTLPLLATVGSAHLSELPPLAPPAGAPRRTTGDRARVPDTGAGS